MKCGFLCLLFILLLTPLWADPRCPLADLPAPPVESADFSALVSALRYLTNQQGQPLLQVSSAGERELEEIFGRRQKTSKLEQFFQLLYWIQKNVPAHRLPLTVRPPEITEVLLAAKVFKTDDFPKRITATTLARDDRIKSPLIQVDFDASEVRFPINGGVGFASWDQGKCQHAKELVFYSGFSFRIRNARNSRNLIVDDFDRVELYGDFGTRKIFKIDLNYVDLQKVEFIRGTDEGKVTARVARREFEENKHSRLFKFIGTLIPNTARQRIDW